MDGNLDLGTIALGEARFYTTIYKGEQADNVTVFSKKFVPKEAKASSEPFILTSSKITIDDGIFRYRDENLSSTDILHLSLIHI